MTIHVHATVEPDGEWWLVTIPKYDIFGQANRREVRKPLQKKSPHCGLIPKKKTSKSPSTTKSTRSEPPFSHLSPSAFL